MSQYEEYERLHPAEKRRQLAEIRQNLGVNLLGNTEGAGVSRPIATRETGRQSETSRHIAVQAISEDVQVVPVATESSVSQTPPPAEAPTLPIPGEIGLPPTEV